MFKTIRAASLVLALFAATTAFAQDRTYEIAGGQVSVPAGVTIQVQSVLVGANVTTVNLIASFDHRQTSRVNLNGYQNGYIGWGDDDEHKLHLRQVTGNPRLTIQNGQSMQGALVFPGTIPADVTQVRLVFNPGNEGDDFIDPGVVVPLELAQ